MFDSRGLPDYPPQVNAWEFPPPPVSPRWKWAAIAAMVLGLVGGSAMLGVAISVGSSGTPGLIDNVRIVNLIEDECALMTDQVESIPITGSRESQAAAISDQNDVVDDMVSAVRGMGSNVLSTDPPTEAWLVDWHKLVMAREDYAEELLDGSTPSLKIPTDDRGEKIYVRMNDVFFYESTCTVPSVLLFPIPEDASDA